MVEGRTDAERVQNWRATARFVAAALALVGISVLERLWIAADWVVRNALQLVVLWVMLCWVVELPAQIDIVQMAMDYLTDDEPADFYDWVREKKAAARANP